MIADEEDGLDPVVERRVVRGGLIACGVFVAGIAWTLRAAPVVASAVAPAPVAAAVVEGAEVEAEAVTRPVLAEGQRTAEVKPGRRLPGLLGLRLGFLRGNDFTDAIAFERVLRGTPAVKLVNLWATWCAPCVRENERFVGLSADWGRDVQFVPIHVGAIGDPAAYRKLVDMMPDAAVSPLVDTSGDAIQGLLRAEALLSPGEGIPITMILDCRDELRWIHVGELVDADGLARRLAALRAELDSPRCALPAATRPPGCGDGVCAPPEEQCASCPDDCRCTTPGTVCRTAPTRPEPHCAYPDSAFTED